MTCFVYRHYSAEGELLYIGATQRLQRAFRKTSWGQLTRKVIVSYYDSKEEAFRAESDAIAEEKPRFNVRRDSETLAQVLARIPLAAFSTYTAPSLAPNVPIPPRKSLPHDVCLKEVEQALAAHDRGEGTER